MDKITAAVPEPTEAFNQSVAKAKRSLEEGMNLVTHRQKLIKLADRSEHWWRVVKEYQSNSLAENEDDEKRIMKAELQQLKKKVAVRPAVPN